MIMYVDSFQELKGRCLHLILKEAPEPKVKGH